MASFPMEEEKEHQPSSECNSTLQKSSFTEYTTNFIECLFHRESTIGNVDIKDDPKNVNICQLSFTGLKDKTFQWEVKRLVDRLGEKVYQLYKQVGIFVEDEIIASDPQQAATCTFSHKTLQEYYAACHLITFHEDHIKSELKQFNPKDVEFFFLFACGLRGEAATIIIKYLWHLFESFKTTSDVLIHCLSEVDINLFLPTVESLCSRKVILSDECKMLQKAKLHLLQTAAQHNILISCLELNQSFSSVDKGNIILQSGLCLCLNSLSSVEVIRIGTETGREISDEEWMALLECSGDSNRLKELRLLWCILPKMVSVPASLESRNVAVNWSTANVFEYEFTLNLMTGRWQDMYTGQELKAAAEEDLCATGKLTGTWGGMLQYYYRAWPWQNDSTSSGEDD